VLQVPYSSRWEMEPWPGRPCTSPWSLDSLLGEHGTCSPAAGHDC
jgi:hypothetical protein